MIEKGVRFAELRLADPVRSVHQISHDPTLKVTVPLTDGRQLTGLDMQRAYHEAAAKYVENTAPTSTRTPPTCSTCGSACWTGWPATR